MRLLVVALAVSATGCVFYEDESAARDASVLWPSPDAWQPPDDWRPDPWPCPQPLPCPSASPNKVSVCGRVWDVETDETYHSGNPTMLACGDGGTGAACALQIRFYDAIDFVGSPTTAVALLVEEFRLDDCGRFVARNISRPAPGLLAVAVDDAPGAPDDHRLTASMFPVTSQQVRTRQRLYLLGTATDDAWSADAGFGDTTFVDRGAYLAVFKHGLFPVAGVTVTGANGDTRPADDFYFGDPEPDARGIVAPAQSSTGANGSALLIGSGLVEHSGSGGEPSGCVWPSDLAASIPGVLFFSERVAEVNPTTDCP